MLTTIKNLSKQYAGSAIRFRNRFSVDSILTARIRMTLLFFLVGTLLFVVIDLITNSSISTLLVNNKIISKSAGEAMADSQIEEGIFKQILFGRAIMTVLLAVAAYFLAGITLRPISRAMEKQKRFVANVSHELRTPISVIKTSSEVALMDKENLTKEEAVRIIEDNLEEINRMAKVVQFFLQFSNFENQQKKLIFSKVSVPSIVSKVVNLLKNEASKKRVDVDFNCKYHSIVWGNATALEEVFLNLIKNAITYTPKNGGPTLITLDRDDNGYASLSIKDSGSGIPDNDLPNIFEPFYRGTNMEGKKGNVGLGLAMVNEIIKLHRGRISVKSTLNKGTTFSILLPSLN